MTQADPRESSAVLEDETFVLLPDDFTLDLSAPPPPPVVAEPIEEVEPFDAAALEDAEATIDAELDAELAFADREARRRVTFLRLLRVVAAVIVLSLPIPVYGGWEYYQLSLGERPFDPLHALLRPSGYLGLSAGVAGTTLILVSLLYLVRKHLVRGYEGLQWWMTCHVVTGLMGPALVVLHTGFLPTSALGQVSLVAMLIVVASGIIGRYLLVYMPRAVEGTEEGRELVRRRLQVYRNKLVALGLDRDAVAAPEPEEDPRRRPWIVTALARVLVGDRHSRREFRHLRHQVRQHRGLGQEARVTLVLVRRLCRERQLYVRYHELRRIVSTWRFLHQWLAVILVSGAFFHIVLAVRYGNLWILGGRD